MGITSRESERFEKPEDRPERAATERTEGLTEQRSRIDWSKELQSQTQPMSELKLPNLEVTITRAKSMPVEGTNARLENKVSRASAKEDAEKQSESPAAPERTFPSVKANAGGFVTHIDYDQNKSREIERDQSTNEATAIITHTPEGTSTLVQRGGSWYMRMHEIELPVPGKIDVSADGTIAMPSNFDGVWRVEKPDGTISEEKENADGARIIFTADHRLEQIRRKDGTSFQQPNDNTIIETRPGKPSVTWTNENGLWSSSSDQPRKNLKLNSDGSVSYEDKDGIKHSINGKGIETLEGAGLGRITPDAAGRPHIVESADGKKQRRYEYFDEKSRDVKSFVVTDAEKGSTTTWTRQSPDKDIWRNERGQVWQGELQCSDDGVHSIKQQRWNQQDTKWTSYHPDGRVTTDEIKEDGSRISFNDKNEIVRYRGADGTRLDRIGGDGGQDQIKYYNPKAGETVTWTKGSDGTYLSDSAKIAELRRDLSFTNNGEITYTNLQGGKVTENRDGTKQVIERNGTKLDFDSNEQIIRATKGNLERTFVREGGEIKVVRDKNLTNKEERTIFERRPGAEENRLQISVNRQGDLSYINPDGTGVIERANMLRLELDRDGDITRVVGPKTVRQMQYIGEGDQKALIAVTDTRQTDRGTKTESWSRVANSDGTLSGEFRSRDENGKERKPRYNLTVCADGEYEYRLATDKPGEKAKIAKLNREGMDGMPESVDDARDELRAVLEGCMDQARVAKNLGFMKTFEKRMMDQTELLIAAGVDQEAAIRETEKTIVETYFHCGRLAGEAQSSKNMYDHRTRVRLAENMLYLAADPTDIKQGGQGTCWWESSWNVGLFQRNANQAARFVTDVALTGQYTSTAGPLRGGACKTIRIRPEYVRINGGRDSGAWTPENARGGSHRSMVGMLIDQIGPPLGGQRGWGQSNAGWHSEARNILYMMTGKDQIRHGSFGIGRHEKIQLLKTGGWTASGNGHMWGYSMKKDPRDGSWVVLKDDQYQGNDHVIERIRDLRSWITRDVRDQVRKEWRPSKNSDRQYAYNPASYTRPTVQVRRNSNDDIAPPIIHMNKPTWQASRIS